MRLCFSLLLLRCLRLSVGMRRCWQWQGGICRWWHPYSCDWYALTAVKISCSTQRADRPDFHACQVFLLVASACHEGVPAWCMKVLAPLAGNYGSSDQFSSQNSASQEAANKGSFTNQYGSSGGVSEVISASTGSNTGAGSTKGETPTAQAPAVSQVATTNAGVNIGSSTTDTGDAPAIRC